MWRVEEDQQMVQGEVVDHQMEVLEAEDLLMVVEVLLFVQLSG